MALCAKDRKGLHAKLPSHHSKEGNEIAVRFTSCLRRDHRVHRSKAPSSEQSGAEFLLPSATCPKKSALARCVRCPLPGLPQPHPPIDWVSYLVSASCLT